MDLDKQVVKIKYELHEEIDIDTVKVENEDPNESDCIKSENAEISDSAGLELDNGVYQSATDKMRIKTEIPDIATKQDREDLSITSLLQTNSYTCYSAWPRKQVEQTKENWGKTSFNKVASKEVKVEDDAKVQCEDKDNSELNQQLDVHMKINSSAELELESAAQKNAPQKDTGKEERYICYICDFSSSCKAGLISHVNRNKCRMKTSAVESPAKSIVHKRHHLSNEYVCTKCRSVFKKKASLDNHIIKQHTEYVASVSTRVHSCRNCDYKTTIRSSFRRHMQVHPKALRYDIDS